MGRPSIKAQRTEQILDAFEWCVAHYGVEGSTLEKIAEKAGLARALIRHNIGNRELLLEKLVKRIIQKSNTSMDSLIHCLPNDNRINTLIDFLFDPKYSDSQMILVISSLVTAANSREKLANELKIWTENFINLIAQEIHKTFPENKEIVTTVATGITGIYFNVDSLTPLGDITNIREHSLKAAKLLISQVYQIS